MKGLLLQFGGTMLEFDLHLNHCQTRKTRGLNNVDVILYSDKCEKYVQDIYKGGCKILNPKRPQYLSANYQYQ